MLTGTYSISSYVVHTSVKSKSLPLEA